MDNLKFSLCIGSYGSYNECNERALGTWIDFEFITDLDMLHEILKSKGYELDGIDEELFIQDTDIIFFGGARTDYETSLIKNMMGWGFEQIIDFLHDNDLFGNTSNLEKLLAYSEAHGGHYVQPDINLDNYTLLTNITSWEDLGKFYFYEGKSQEDLNQLRDIVDYIDFEKYGKSYEHDTFLTDYGMLY